MLFKNLGVGVGLRTVHLSHFLNQAPQGIQWAEVISENFMDWQNAKPLYAQKNILKIREHLPLAMHGVSLSIGSTAPLNKNYLKALKSLAKRLEPIWISDHLCWTGVGGHNLHDLLPMPYTEEALAHVVTRVKQVQDFLGHRILLENVSSYGEFKCNEMTEWQFLAQVAERADCGILLDINNIYVSAFNHGFDPMNYLCDFPFHRVGQIHLAGHTRNPTFLIDTHDHPVCDDVWHLYEWFCTRHGLRSSMIEWDAQIPEWDVLHAETQKIAHIMNKFERDKSQKPDLTLRDTVL